MVSDTAQYLKISQREWRVVKMLAVGVTPAHIAERLSLSSKTVSLHINNVQRKCQIENRLKLQNLLIAMAREADHVQNVPDAVIFSSLSPPHEK